MSNTIPSGNIISRSVTVNLLLSPMQALEATGQPLYVIKSVAETMPRCNKSKQEVFFVKHDRWMGCTDWSVYLDSLGLKPCDPYTLAKVNEDDREFANKYPNRTHWRDCSETHWCVAIFARWGGKRRVDIYKITGDGYWNSTVWFASVLK